MSSPTTRIRELLDTVESAKGNTRWLAAHLALLNAAQDYFPALCDVSDAARELHAHVYSGKQGNATQLWNNLDRALDALDALYRAAEEKSGA